MAEIAFSPWDHVLALAWSPDGSLLAAAAGSQVYIYRYPDLTQAAVLPIGVRCSQLVFDPFATPERPLLAAAVRDGSLQLWDPLSGSLMARWEAHRKSANSLAFSPDGNSLASVGNDAMVRIWDLSQFRISQDVLIEMKAEMIGGAVAVPAVRYSPDGLLLASVDLGVIRLRDPQTQRLVRTLHTETSLFDIVFSPDGGWLAAAEMDNQVQIWDPASGELVSALTVPGKPAGTARAFVWTVLFNTTGSLLAAGSSTGRLAIWSVPGQELVLETFAHSRGISALAFHPDGSVLATGGLDGTLRVWSTR